MSNRVAEAKIQPQARRSRWSSARAILPYLGPAFIVSVGYMDPGNWATDIEGGSRFNYDLLWVVFASGMIAIFLQILTAKLGIATGRGLAANCRKHFSRPMSYFLWVTAELAMMATDLAEFLGAVIGIHMIFNLPMLTAVWVTGLDVLLFLFVMRYGYRAFEFIIISLIGFIGLGYLIELVLARPDWVLVALKSFVPTLNPDPTFVLVGIGILGATVMPHNLYLHSTHILTRQNAHSRGKKLFRLASLDTVLALTAAWWVNAAILIMAAAVFYRNDLLVVSIEAAHRTLIPLLGGFAALVFAIALLASGLASSTAGTLAGQIVMEEFLNIKFPLWLRRLLTRILTMIPALLAVSLGVAPVKLMVLSQVALSFQLPFAIIPIVLFTRRRDLMGALVNRPGTTALAILIVTLIIALNVLLLVQIFNIGS